MTTDHLIALALLLIALAIARLADAVEKAGKWIGEALWHPSYQAPPRWWKR